MTAAVGWDTRLQVVLGGTAAWIGKHIGYTTVGQLLSHYPRTFVPREEASSVADLVVGEPVTVVGAVASVTVHPYQDRRTGRQAYRTEAAADLDGGRLWMTFFDTKRGVAEGRREKLEPGRRVLLSGKVERNRFKQGRLELTHPDFDVKAAERARSSLQPIYPVTGKLRSWTLENAVAVVLDVLTEVPALVPDELRSERGLLGARQALEWIHRPQDWQQYGAATKRLRFEEAFVAQVALAQRRHEQRGVGTTARTGRPGGAFDAFDELLPFTLTEGQRRVEEEVLADLAERHPMHRLLQGEVGSGKTVVALRAMLRVVDSGGQAALLAPTEVLAQQHHRSLTALLGDLAAGGMLGGAPEATRVALVTGSQSASARRTALLEAASGEAGIVIGTHALLEDKVQFADLGLVVVDEQHRFGVEQRAALSTRTEGSPPHVLVMTATPIPRTVAMTVFGDLETSSLAELPAGRGEIQTTVVPLAEQPAWLDRVWSRVREEVRAGRQVYVVCPRISGDDEADVAVEPDPEPSTVAGEGSEGRSSRRPAAVEELTPQLVAGPLAGLRVAPLHGRLAADTKDEVMRAFAAGDVDVLVSTTVIEVGVDVANATTMVVLDADRFGVSQLHQLRGRVGRGGHHGLCLLVTGAPLDSPARQRLEAVAATTDGFRLAELDLTMRREGDVLGSNQSGSRRTLRLLSVVRDADIIEEARAAAVDLVERDPGLASVPPLRSAVAALHESQRTDYLDKT